MKRLVRKSWPWLLLLGLMGWSAAVVFFPITDTDIWWHLAAGRRIVHNLAFIYWDPFSAISFGKPWIDVHWGFQVLVYGLWLWGGAVALVMAKAFLAVMGVALTWGQAIKCRAWPWLIPPAAFATYHLRYLNDIRPLWVTLIFLAVQYHAARRYALQTEFHSEHKSHLQKNLNPLLLLGICQIGLANTQGLFLLGPIFFGIFVWGERRRQGHRFLNRWDMLIVLALVWVSLLNPYGYHAFALALQVGSRIIPASNNIFSTDMAENLPLFSALHHDLFGYLPLFLLHLLGLGGGWIFRHLRLWGEAGLFLFTCLLAGMAIRNLPLSMMALGFLFSRIALATETKHQTIALNFSRLPFSPKRILMTVYLLGLPGLIFAIQTLCLAAKYELPKAWITPFRLPMGAADFLAEHPIPGQIFNELRQGGYLIWRFGKPEQCFIDGRMVLRTASQFREWLEVIDQPAHFGAFRKRYHITHVLLPLIEWDRYRALALYLLNTKSMRMVYCDGASVLLADTASVPSGIFETVTQTGIQAEINLRFGANPLLANAAKASAEDLWQRAASPGPSRLP